MSVGAGCSHLGDFSSTHLKLDRDIPPNLPSLDIPCDPLTVLRLLLDLAVAAIINLGFLSQKLIRVI